MGKVVKAPGREHDVVVTIAGADPSLTELVANEIATYFNGLGVFDLSKVGDWSVVNTPAEAVDRLKRLLAIGKRAPSLLVDDAGDE